MKQRIESLDWLRGLMAVSIMIYHLWGWLFFELNSSSVLGRLGIYGVSIFFILSGLSMAIVYSDYLDSPKKSVFFLIRRIFRIWPLLWVCIALVIIPSMVLGHAVSVLQIIANLTTIFGFIKPSAYINTGAWSIGNEMVYYVFTPIIIALYNRKLILGNIFLVVSFIISFIFSFILLNTNISLADQWNIYINPFNNLFLYVVGIALFYNFKGKQVNQIFNFVIMCIAVFLFIFYPVSGNQIYIVTGLNRLVFVSISIALVFSFYKFSLGEYIPK